MSDHLAAVSLFDSDEWMNCLQFFNGWTSSDEEAEETVRQLVGTLKLRPLNEPGDVDSPLLRSQIDEQYLRAMASARAQMSGAVLPAAQKENATKQREPARDGTTKQSSFEPVPATQQIEVSLEINHRPTKNCHEGLSVSVTDIILYFGTCIAGSSPGLPQGKCISTFQGTTRYFLVASGIASTTMGVSVSAHGAVVGQWLESACKVPVRRRHKRAVWIVGRKLFAALRHVGLSGRYASSTVLSSNDVPAASHGGTTPRTI